MRDISPQVAECLFFTAFARGSLRRDGAAPLQPSPGNVCLTRCAIRLNNGAFGLTAMDIIVD